MAHYPIELFSYSGQEQAKSQVEHQMRKQLGWGFSLNQLPEIVGIGIGYGAVIVTVAEDHWSHDAIPTELEDSFVNCPVKVEYGGYLHPLQGPLGPGGPSRQGGHQPGGGAHYPSQGVVQGGISIRCREQGTVFGVLQGASNPSQKYAVTSSHVVQGGSCSVGGRTIGRMAKDARPCNQKVYLDAASILLNQGVQSSPNIIGLGMPKRFRQTDSRYEDPSRGVTSGHVDSEVTQINFTQKGNTNAQGNCPVTFMDLFVTSRCGTNGDSGSAQWSDDGYLIGIVTFGSTEHGGKTDKTCKGYNPSVWRMPQLLGITTQTGDSGVQARPQQRTSNHRRSGWYAGFRPQEPITIGFEDYDDYY